MIQDVATRLLADPVRAVSPRPPQMRAGWRSCCSWSRASRSTSCSHYFVDTPYGWLDTAIAVASASGIVAAAVYLMPPVTILVAGIFLDDIAGLVERRYYPEDPPGRALPACSRRPPVHGVLPRRPRRQHRRPFAAAPARHQSRRLLPGQRLPPQPRIFRACGHALSRSAEMREPCGAPMAATSSSAGLFIAAVVSVPILNLVTPLFGTALMVHLHKRLSGRLPSPDGRPRRPP